jgi:hypothetical protein
MRLRGAGGLLTFFLLSRALKKKRKVGRLRGAATLCGAGENNY